MHQQNQNTTLDHIFRHEYGKIISILTHKFGPQNLEKIEDVVQDAFLKAMQVWGYKEVPQNPTAWLLRVANNGLIDVLRKSKKHQEHDHLKLPQDEVKPQEVILENAIQDSQLKMIFACCNPALSSESQLILSLKLIGGFSNKEISRALLKKEDAIAKSFTRAKKKFREHIKTLDIPVEMALSSRINLVLKVIYLLFSEGYTASTGEEIIKRDICYEAIRLALLLTENSSTDASETHALIALMCFHTARFDARTSDEGELIDLEHQDRSKYNKELIRIGMGHFRLAERKTSQNPLYFLQAAVSYTYCEAQNFEEIQWKRILHAYDLQLKYSYSPIIRLNRIVSYYKVYGAQKGLEVLEEIYKDCSLEENGLYHSIKAQLLHELSEYSKAKESYSKAIKYTKNEVQKKHLSKKRDQM
ncbi:RNA polymerase sigma factor [Pseudotenacibaculum haliotis]|uniref:RNA polymerase sigma factor n=1 Tax=Pseudotenacibaculum haliotis TaxID=1862138 RepID=A0ABW5LT14_9FLAO